MRFLADGSGECFPDIPFFRAASRCALRLPLSRLRSETDGTLIARVTILPHTPAKLRAMDPSPTSASPPTFAGVRLYSPRAIVAYAVIFNLPLAGFLVGLNVRARGSRTMGFVIMAAASFAGLALAGAVASGLSPDGLMLFGIVGGLVGFQLERRPFAVALSQGATPARWWPPALIVTIGLAGVVLAECAVPG